MNQPDKLDIDGLQNKEKERLTISLEFIVERAEHYTTPIYEWDGFIGQRSVSRLSGILQRTLLQVRPILRDDVPIKQLDFNGYSFIQKGDRINAEIRKYDRYNNDEFLNLDGKVYNAKDHSYIERDFKEKEKVSYIEKLGVNGEVLAKFVSPNDCEQE